jgi:hypothetical protein
MEHHRHAALLPRREFLRRLTINAGLAGALIAVALSLGVAGYHVFGRLSWLDALVNASMILAGMGAVDPITTAPGKLFASFYALFSGVAFLTIMAVLLAPAAHRFLHRFHLELSDDPPGKER